MLKKDVNFCNLCEYILKIIAIEKINATRNGQIAKHEKKWSGIKC